MDRRLIPFGFIFILSLVLIVYGLFQTETARTNTVSQQVGDFTFTVSTDKKVYQEDEFVLVTTQLDYTGKQPVTIKHGVPMVRIITVPRDYQPKGQFRSPSLKQTKKLQAGESYNPDGGYEFALEAGEYLLLATVVFEADGKEQRISLQIPLTVHTAPLVQKPLQADALLSP